MSLGDVDTPALVLDLDAFERNLARLPAAIRGSGARVRPHAKSHKCVEIARRQLHAGAIGICCQKVSEAEVFVEGGVVDVLITNEVVGRAKVRRLAQLAQRARIGVCADDAGNVAELSAAAEAAGVVLDVLVEINIGGNRCGVQPGDEAVQLALTVGNAPGLRFAGLHAYQGSAQHMRAVAQRRAASQLAASCARATRDALAAYRVACETITGGGTGTFFFDAASGIYNEVQPGSYIFMDADYLRNDWQDVPLFEPSLYVESAVMSAAAAGRVVVDAGLKALAVDSGLPVIRGSAGLTYAGASDEHGVIAVPEGVAAPRLGDRLQLLPGHCDPTVNLHDHIVAVRGGRVEEVWAVDARGALF